MKYYQLMILIPLITACTTKNAGLENLEANAKEFNDFSNTAYLLNSKEIAYFTLTDSEIKIQLINKDRLSDNKIVSCQVNNKPAVLVEDSSQSWDNNYIISLDSIIKKAKIECKLSDGRTLTQTISRY